MVTRKKRNAEFLARWKAVFERETKLRSFPDQWALIQEIDQLAREGWDRLHKAKRKGIRLAKLGRRFLEVRVPVSETQAVKITNGVRKLQKDGKLFAAAFSRRYDMEEVKR